MKRRVFVRPDGTIESIYDDALRPLLEEGTAVITRASHVEPDPNHPTQWLVDLSPRGGPVQGGFLKRDEALAWEADWLEHNGLGRRK